MSKKIANILIHGFGGDFDEIEYLKLFLQARGHFVYTASLAGHRGTKKDLSRSSYVDWLKSVNSSIKSLYKKYDKINLIGFSMGGLLAMNFAHLGKVGSIVCINSPIFFWNIKLIAKDILNGIIKKDYEKIKYYTNSVGKISIKSSLDFICLLITTSPKIRHIKKPTLILQCKDDETVWHNSAKYIQKRVAGSKMKLYEGGSHRIFLNDYNIASVICRDIELFLKKNTP